VATTDLQEALLLLPQPLHLRVDAPQPGLVLALHAAGLEQSPLALLETVRRQLGGAQYQAFIANTNAFLVEE